MLKSARLAEAHQRLAESQSHTDQRLDAFINFIDDKRNGQP